MMPSARFPDLKGASVLITGGGSGIGAALTESFARQGSKVAFIDIAAEASHALCDHVEQATAIGRCSERGLRDVSAARRGKGGGRGARPWISRQCRAARHKARG
jgi:NAD(P)-dependent dehydrogenase (short-subunit alcohol dehydrogenase family)